MLDQLIEAFTIDRIQSSNAVFDYDRLLWFNAHYIRELPADRFVSLLQDYLMTYGGERWVSLLDAHRTDEALRMSIAEHMQTRLQNF